MTTFMPSESSVHEKNSFTNSAKIASNESPSMDSETLRFATLQKFARQQHQKENQKYTQDKEIEQIFNEKLHCYQVVSFDIFDTLLVRAIDHPSNVFFFLKDEPVFHGCSFSAPLHYLRADAESLARQALFNTTGSGEVNLSEIYAVFCKRNNLSLNLIPQFVAAEENVERKLCYPNPFFLKLYQRAIDAGKRVVIATDMYLHKTFLLQLLSEKGFPVAEKNLFVSSDLRVSKQDGALFNKMLDDLQIQPKNVLHLGDHFISDYKKPEEMGINVLLHTHKASSNEMNRCYSEESAAVQSYLRGMIRVKRHTTSLPEDFWTWMGYRVFGPLTTGFCCWLNAQFQADGIEKAWFLLRDGELPYRVWNELYPDHPSVKAGLIPSSRRAFVFPTLEIAPMFALQNLLSCIKPLPVRKYLERLKVSAEDLESEFKDFGFTSLDEMIDARIDKKRLCDFFCRPRVMKALLARSRQERRLTEAFFKQEGMFEKKRFAVIDLGWNGTIQKTIYLMLSDQREAPSMKGYYFATRASFMDNNVLGVEHASYLAYKGIPNDIDQAIRSCFVFLETVYSSLSGSLVCFKRNANKIEGVFQNPDKTEKQAMIVSKIHEGTLRFVHDFKKSNQDFSFSDVPSLVAAEELFRLFSHPTPEEAKQIGNLTHCENYGMATFLHIAKFSSGCQPQQILDDFYHSLWKQGMIGQNNAQAMALRNLLWLMNAENHSS
jgi:predicted HAD superfamily hydrolase